MLCPGPLFKGKCMKNCNQDMQLKPVKDRKDGLTWRCRKKHKVIDGNKVYTVHDIKVRIRQYSWMEDSNLKLEDIVEMINLWSQHHDLATIEHELKISTKTLIEWFTYIRDACTTKGIVLTCYLKVKHVFNIDM